MRVFISCVSDEFRAYRTELRGELAGRSFEIQVQEDFQDGGHTLLEKLDGYIARCDAVIHLVGDGLGSSPKAAELRWLLGAYPDLPRVLPELAPWLDPEARAFSYTQWEAFLAIYHRVPCYVYRADEGSRRETGFVATPEATAAQRAHLDRLRSLGKDRRTEPFTDPLRLANRFLKCLIDVDRGRAPPVLDPARPYAWPQIADPPAHQLADREDELRLFVALASGRSQYRALLLHGPSDRGKSVLLGRLHELATGLPGLALGLGELKAGQPLPEVLARVRRDLQGQRFPRYERALAESDPLEALRSAFLDDLAECTDPVLLILDTYEQASADTQRWVEEQLLGLCCRYQGLRLVIAGQVVPNPGGVAGSRCKRRELPPIADRDPWRDFYGRVLGGADLPDDHLDLLLKATGGSPRVMSTLLANLAGA